MSCWLRVWVCVHHALSYDPCIIRYYTTITLSHRSAPDLAVQAHDRTSGGSGTAEEVCGSAHRSSAAHAHVHIRQRIKAWLAVKPRQNQANAQEAMSMCLAGSSLECFGSFIAP